MQYTVHNEQCSPPIALFPASVHHKCTGARPLESRQCNDIEPTHHLWCTSDAVMQCSEPVVFVQRRTASELWIFLTLGLQILFNFDQTWILHPPLFTDLLLLSEQAFLLFIWNQLIFKVTAFSSIEWIFGGFYHPQFPFLCFVQLPPFEFTFSDKLHLSLAKVAHKKVFP